jgi:hypothetical protein
MQSATFYLPTPKKKKFTSRNEGKVQDVTNLPIPTKLTSKWVTEDMSQMRETIYKPKTKTFSSAHSNNFRNKTPPQIEA